MSDPKPDYDQLFVDALTKREAFDAIAAKIRSVHILLRDMADLNHLPRPAAPPAHIGDGWPAAGDIERAIEEWHEAGHRLRAAFEALPPPARLTRALPAQAKIPNIRPA